MQNAVTSSECRHREGEPGQQAGSAGVSPALTLRLSEPSAGHQGARENDVSLTSPPSTPGRTEGRRNRPLTTRGAESAHFSVKEPSKCVGLRAAQAPKDRPGRHRGTERATENRLCPNKTLFTTGSGPSLALRQQFADPNMQRRFCRESLGSRGGSDSHWAVTRCREASRKEEQDIPRAETGQ